MGQYWVPVNLDKREIILPHTFGSGLKLWEIIACGEAGVGTALCILLADMPEPRGNGDLDADPFIGRWAGDRIALVGDYSKEGDKCYVPDIDDFTDISEHVAEIIERKLNGTYESEIGNWRQWKRKD